MTDRPPSGVTLDSDMIDVNGQVLVGSTCRSMMRGRNRSSRKRGWKGHPRSGLHHAALGRPIRGSVALGREVGGLVRIIRRDVPCRDRNASSILTGPRRWLIGPKLSMIGEDGVGLSEMLFSQRGHSGAIPAISTVRCANRSSSTHETSRTFIFTRQALLKAHIGSVRHAICRIRER